jgi:hypothetical protein
MLHTQVPEHSGKSPLHGTVNVFLANGHTLAVATDSMLTETTRTPNGLTQTTHTPNGLKLYKINSRTVAAMASFYSESGPIADDSLNASIPQIMREFSGREFPPHVYIEEHMPFTATVGSILDEIKFKLDRHLRTMVASDPHFNINSPNLMLELTIAGYDLDNSIKISEITLMPGINKGEIEYVSKSRRFGPFTPPCAYTAGFEQLSDRSDSGPVIFSVRDSLFCEVAGLKDVPEQMLKSPANYPNDVALQGYVKAMSEKRQLNAAELRELAIDLVNATSSYEHHTGQNRVGGEVEVAVLENGHLIEEPKPVLRNDEGRALDGNRIKEGNHTCTSPQSPYGKNGTEESSLAHDGILDLEVTLTNCNQELDGIMFTNSVFVGSHLTYSGKLPLYFFGSNLVHDTTLELGVDVDVHSPAVQNLVCKFQWKSVYQGGKEVKRDCRKEDGQ